MKMHKMSNWLRIWLLASCLGLALPFASPLIAPAQADTYGLRQCTVCGQQAYRSPCDNCRTKGFNGTPISVSEPGTLLLLSTGLGLVSLAAIRRYRKNK